MMELSRYLVVVGGFAIAAPRPATAAPTERYPVRVEIDAEALADADGFDDADADLTTTKLQGGVERLLEQQGLSDDAAQDVVTLYVRVSWVDIDASDYAVAVDVTMPDGQNHPLASTTCTLCSDDDLLKHIGQKFQLVEELSERPAVVEAEPVTEGVTPRVQEPTQDEQPHRPLTTQGKVGISLMVVGTSAAIGGGVMLAIGAPSDDLPGERTVGVDLGTPGVVVLGGGGLLLVSGAIMLILDRRKSRPKQALVPVVGPRFTGFTFESRF